MVPDMDEYDRETTGGVYRTVNYDATQYSETKALPFRIYVEKYTLFQLAGDVHGKRVADIGCGEGVYSRELVKRGAEYVLGIDNSADFIKLALRKNKEYEGRIDYQLAAIQDSMGEENMDLAIGSYILSYPRNLEEAIAYCRGIASYLKKGGEFVGFNNNPFEVFDGVKYSKYGFEKEMHGGKEGGEVIYRVKGLEQPITNYYLSPETYERAFKEAGFFNFRFRRAILDRSVNPEKKSDEHWRQFFSGESPFIAMTANK